MDPQQIQRMKDLLMHSYKSGEILSLLLGTEIDRQMETAAESVPCYDKGCAAELRRLKDFLKPPADWEQQRFERYLKESA